MVQLNYLNAIRNAEPNLSIKFKVMIDLNLLAGKSFALLIYNSEDEKDVRVFKGEAVQKEDGFYFVNEEEKWQLALTPEILSRIKEVQPAVKRILLNADYGVTLTLGILPGGPPEGFEPTGIKWQ